MFLTIVIPDVCPIFREDVMLDLNSVEVLELNYTVRPPSKSGDVIPDDVRDRSISHFYFGEY